MAECGLVWSGLWYRNLVACCPWAMTEFGTLVTGVHYQGLQMWLSRLLQRLGRFAPNLMYLLLVSYRLCAAHGYGKIWSLVEIWLWLPIRMWGHSSMQNSPKVLNCIALKKNQWKSWSLSRFWVYENNLWSLVEKSYCAAHCSLVSGRSIEDIIRRTISNFVINCLAACFLHFTFLPSSSYPFYGKNIM
jgi:hypothetical protein